MSRPKKIAIILIALVIALSVFSIRFGNKKESDLVPISAEQPISKPAHDQPQAILRESNGNPSRIEIEKRMGRTFSEEEIELKPPDVPWHAWAFSIEAHKIAAEKNGEIAFFGKVVSEEGFPMEGVVLTAKVEISETSYAKALATGVETHVRTIKLTTDEDGEFEIKDFGRHLTVADFEKPGYSILGEKKYKGIAPKKSWSYSFIANSPSSFQPDPRNPEVFTMRKVE